MTCAPVLCQSGELAPIPVGECCPSQDQCENKNCDEVIEKTSRSIYGSVYQLLYAEKKVYRELKNSLSLKN